MARSPSSARSVGQISVSDEEKRLEREVREEPSNRPGRVQREEES
jgi:hypothetical protein